MGLLDSVKGVLTNAVVDKAADALGIENGMMKTAMKFVLPAIIGGVINKGSSESGAGGLIDLFKNGGFGDGNLGDLAGVLGNDEKRGGLLETGTDLLGTIFGNNQSGVLDMILKATGITKSGGSSLMSFLAPIVINKLAGIVFGKKMSASGLASYLGDQKSDIMGMVPGMSALLGGGDVVKEAVGVSSSSSSSDSEGGGMGFLKYLLPLLILGAIGYWWMNRDTSGTADDKTEITTEVDEGAKETVAAKPKVTTSEDANSNTDTTSPSSYTLNSNGDVVNGNGAVIYASGSYLLDDSGNLIDKASKRILLPAASISSGLGEKLKGLLSGLTSTVTQEDMKKLFGDMIMKKSNRTSYALSNIEFNKEDHKISNFSKAEVMGLAEALKANVNGHIEVQVFTNDGKDEKESNKLSDTRANVIRDMLVTLGVAKKQISAKGMGISDAEKASRGKVDIVIK